MYKSPRNKTLLAALVFCPGLAISDQSIGQGVNECAHFLTNTAGPWAVGRYPIPNNPERGGPLSFAIGIEGDDDSRAMSCAFHMDIPFDEVDESRLTGTADRLGMGKLTIKVPGHFYANCHADRPDRVLAVQPVENGVSVRLVYSVAAGRVCAQNYGMQ